MIGIRKVASVCIVLALGAMLGVFFAVQANAQAATTVTFNPSDEPSWITDYYCADTIQAGSVCSLFVTVEVPAANPRQTVSIDEVSAGKVASTDPYDRLDEFSYIDIDVNQGGEFSAPQGYKRLELKDCPCSYTEPAGIDVAVERTIRIEIFVYYPLERLTSAIGAPQTYGPNSGNASAIFAVDTFPHSGFRLNGNTGFWNYMEGEWVSNPATVEDAMNVSAFYAGSHPYNTDGQYDVEAYKVSSAFTLVQPTPPAATPVPTPAPFNEPEPTEPTLNVAYIPPQFDQWLLNKAEAARLAGSYDGRYGEFTHNIPQNLKADLDDATNVLLSCLNVPNNQLCRSRGVDSLAAWVTYYAAKTAYQEKRTASAATWPARKAVLMAEYDALRAAYVTARAAYDTQMAVWEEWNAKEQLQGLRSLWECAEPEAYGVKPNNVWCLYYVALDGQITSSSYDTYYDAQNAFFACFDKAWYAEVIGTDCTKENTSHGAGTYNGFTVEWSDGDSEVFQAVAQ